MKKSAFGPAILLVFLSLIGQAQVDSIALNFANGIQKSSIQTNLGILASDSLEGRETTRDGQRKAADYIISQFKAANVGPGNGDSYLQSFDIVERSLHHVQIDLGDKSWNSKSDEIFNYNAELAFNLETADLVFAGYGISDTNYDDYTHLDVKDKVVVLLNGNPGIRNEDYEPENKDLNSAYKLFYYKLELAKQKGAKAIIFLRNDYDAYRARVERYYHDRNMGLFDSTETPVQENLNCIFMNDSIFPELFDRSLKERNKYLDKVYAGKAKKTIASKNKAKIKIEIIESFGVSTNVMAAIEVDPDADWLVLSAHYDHIGVIEEDVYNGADDNGSGTSAIIELAKVFQAAHDSGQIAKKNILFMLVSGEEKGLLGSKYYTQHPIYPLDQTLANLNIDMIGRWDESHTGKEDYVYVIGADRISQKLHDINEEANTLYTGLDLDYTYNAEDDPNRYYYRSDHYNFAKNGIPVIFYYNGTHEDYHKKTDTEEKIDYAILKKRTELVFFTAWKLVYMDGGLL